MVSNLQFCNIAQLRDMHGKEISDLQLTMARQEAVIECQKTEIENLTENMRTKNSELANSNKQYVRVTRELEALQKQLEASSHKVRLTSVTVSVLPV